MLDSKNHPCYVAALKQQTTQPYEENRTNEKKNEQ